MKKLKHSGLVTAWSYSRYADYELCPLRFKLKHIDRLPDPGSAAMVRGSDIHKEGENYLKLPAGRGGKAPATVPSTYAHFKTEMAELHSLSPMVEQQWGFTATWEPTSWFGKETWLRVVCDVAVYYDDDTLDIIDFKTGRKYTTNEDQIELFSMGGFARFPEVNHVTARLWYLDIADGPSDGDPHEDSTANTTIREYTRDEFDEAKLKWEDKIQPMFVDTKFPPRANEKCKWCPYSKSKGGPCKF